MVQVLGQCLTLAFLIFRRSPTVASNLPMRIRYLLDFFDSGICPVLVAGDDHMNPYRAHLLPLALQSDMLQSAIAALSLNNLRMRGGIEGRRLSLAEDLGLLPDHSYSKMTAQELREMHGGEPSAEEKHYKAKSIALLNKKLADQEAAAEDDSILATLLVLCLFHVCDSGFSRFKTQLAGVQKLLSMRDMTVQSSFVRWISFFFTWFDVMTSTVNDRETEVQGDALDMMNWTANLGASEHLSGCEGRLFKLIARLGRLNLLSQNRPVREDNSTPCPSPRPQKQRDFYSFNFNNIDGNGWTQSADLVLGKNPLNRVAPGNDRRLGFWNEWSEIRNRLQEWESDLSNGPLTPSTLSSLSLSPAELASLHMSESFRYAALLYTERLANPSSPSSFVNFQSTVSRGLYHISQIGITSPYNKFILWPLFILGSEATQLEHRALVRQRCIEIQRESGFYNNLSGLEVLEKVWQDDDNSLLVGDDERSLSLQSHSWPPTSDGSTGATSQPQQAFRWRKAMDRVDGEYIII